MERIYEEQKAEKDIKEREEFFDENWTTFNEILKKVLKDRLAGKSEPTVKGDEEE